MPYVSDIPQICSFLAAFGAMAIVLLMPMRDPDLSTDDISPPFEPATSALRSPEDNLNLWQFMTVSWMTPLISAGYKRQLNDDDVWKLSYQFQHSRLLDSFREVQGSVVKRLMKANGLDLTIQTILGIVENLGSMCLAFLLLPSVSQSFQSNNLGQTLPLLYCYNNFFVQWKTPMPQNVPRLSTPF